ncbi:hypothetical protein AAHA92_06294 [Salvia divinorum]|uniref:Uncharacterized protein n=1 Tax=Salvia divinorum TaxID=28513 RepID=A0ABD1I577_SALDI
MRRRIEFSGFSPFIADDSVSLSFVFSFPIIRRKDVVVWDQKPLKRNSICQNFETMKERFAKLLLGKTCLEEVTEFALR